MADIGRIGVPKSLLAISNRDFKDFSKSLNIGDVLKGKIISNLGESKYGINFRGFNIVAESEHAFQEGDVIKGQVRMLEPKVLLRLVSSDALVGVLNKEQYANILTQSSVKPFIGDVFRGMDSLVKLLESQEIVSTFPELVSIVDSMRKMSLDSKSKDSLSKIINLIFSKNNRVKLSGALKGINAKLIDAKFLKSIGLAEKNASFLRNITSDILKNFEAQSYLNKSLKDHGLMAYLQLPINLNESTQTLEFKIYKDGQGKNKEDIVNIQVGASTTSLGDLMFILTVQGNSIDAVALSESKETGMFLQAYAENFKQLMENKNFSLKSFSSIQFNSPEAEKIGKGNQDFFKVRRIDTVA